VDAHTFTKQAEKFQEKSARKLMATVFWGRTVLMVEFMQQGTTKKSIRSVL
jgi:hypothetical protein